MASDASPGFIWISCDLHVDEAEVSTRPWKGLVLICYGSKLKENNFIETRIYLIFPFHSTATN